jgi:hypothetical protein
MADKIIPDSGAATPAGKPQLPPTTTRLADASVAMSGKLSTFFDLI